MNLTFKIDTGGIERKFELLTESVKDVEPALRIWDKYYAGRVQQRFNQGGPGWEPLTEEQSRRNMRKAMRSFMRKLGREGLRAAEKAEKVEAQIQALSERHSPEFVEWYTGLKGGLGTRRTRAVRALQRRVLTLEEARRLIQGEGRSGLLKEKAAAKLEQRLGRAMKKGERILGRRLPNSFKSKIQKGTLTRWSEVPWAGVHNEGGTVGRGAQIPARPFLYLEEMDVEVLVETLRNSMLLAMET